MSLLLFVCLFVCFLYSKSSMDSRTDFFLRLLLLSSVLEFLLCLRGFDEVFRLADTDDSQPIGIFSETQPTLKNASRIFL